MKKSSKILVSSLAILLLGGSGTGYYLYTNNDARQALVKLVVPKATKKQTKQSDTTPSSNKSATVNEAKNNNKEATGKVDSGFESPELATDDEISEVTNYLNTFNDEMASLSVDELNSKYFIDGKADLLKPYYNIGYKLDMNSLKVHKTKAGYLLEWGAYLKHNSLSHRVVGTYDKNMKRIRLIVIE